MRKVILAILALTLLPLAAHAQEIDEPAEVGIPSSDLPGDPCFYQGQWYYEYAYAASYSGSGSTEHNLAPCVPREFWDPGVVVTMYEHDIRNGEPLPVLNPVHHQLDVFMWAMTFVDGGTPQQRCSAMSGGELFWSGSKLVCPGIAYNPGAYLYAGPTES